MNNKISIRPSGKISKLKRTGNPGKFIVQLKRRRTPLNSDPTYPAIVTESLWQVVKAVKGTWLTAVAKYGDGLNWKDEDLHRVYYDEWVQKCDPEGRDSSGAIDDTKEPYSFWETFCPGGMWEDGILKPPRKAGYRDGEIEAGDYWCFKISEIAKFTMPDMEDHELLRRRKEMFDRFFYLALKQKDKSLLLDELNQKEKAAKAYAKAKLKDEEAYEKYAKLLQDLKERVIRATEDQELADAEEFLYEFQLEALDEQKSRIERMENLVVREIEYLKFRCAQYDNKHEKDQEVVKIQKGTPEEDQWKKHPEIVLT